MDDYDNAIRTMSKAVEANSGKDYYQLCRRGFYYMQAGMFEEAMEDYTKATAVNSYSADAYFGKCAVLYKQGRLEEARVEYEKGIVVDPEMECMETEPDDLLDIVARFSRGI